MNRTIKKGIEITGKCKLSDTDNGISWQHMASSPCNNNKKNYNKNNIHRTKKKPPGSR